MYALDYFKRRLHHFGLLDGDHAVLADLLHGFGNDAANLLVGVGTDCADLGDHAALHLAREPLNLSEGNFNGIIDAAIERHRACAGGYRSHAFTEIAWASTVAVVPSPATSEVLDATSRTICAPMFSSGSRSSISFATLTASFVMMGEPNTGDRGSRDSETVVGVFERWRNTRTHGRSADLDVVPPGATSRGTAISVAGSTRISFGRAAVVAGVVPVSHTIHVRCRPDYEGRKRLADTVSLA